MKMKKIYLVCMTAVMAFFAVQTASAQSKTFKMAQWIEIHNSIIKELNTSYVDSLPVDRIMRAGVDAMLEELDPYTIYIPEEENEDFQLMISNTYGGIGAIIHKKKEGPVIINEPYANSPAQKYGLRCGDEILAIDGTPTPGLETKESTDRMKGKPGTSVVFTVKKAVSNEIVDITVVRERIHLPDINYAGMIDDTTGYISYNSFTEGGGANVKDKVLDLKRQGMKRLVLDLRGNGGGLMGEAINIASLFLPKGSLVVSSKGNTENSLYEYHTTSDPIDTKTPIIVLINSGSASASEIVAGALQDHDRAVIMGTRSYGKGLVQAVRPLVYNGQLKVTTAKYYTPSGRCVQAIDYSNRNEDGSVGYIPDSLTTEFKTASGRIVKDGGGITPDVTLEYKEYSRLVYSLVLGGVVDQYVIDYCKRYESIPAVDDFHYTAEDYEDFIRFAKTQEFDYRSSAKTLYDEMKKELEKDGLAETMKDQLAALEKSLDIEKEQFLRLKMDEIIPFIEEEIVTRYWFQEAGVKINLRYDDQLKQALVAPLPF
jgi:carboxyl-terminal processing protease